MTTLLTNTACPGISGIMIISHWLRASAIDRHGKLSRNTSGQAI